MHEDAWHTFQVSNSVGDPQSSDLTEYPEHWTLYSLESYDRRTFTHGVRGGLIIISTRDGTYTICSWENWRSHIASSRVYLTRLLSGLVTRMNLFTRNLSFILAIDITIYQWRALVMMDRYTPNRLLSSLTPTARSVNCIFVNIRESMLVIFPRSSFLWSWASTSEGVLPDSAALWASRRAWIKHELELLVGEDALSLWASEDFLRWLEANPASKITWAVSTYSYLCHVWPYF